MFTQQSLPSTACCNTLKQIYLLCSGMGETLCTAKKPRRPPYSTQRWQVDVSRRVAPVACDAASQSLAGFCIMSAPHLATRGNLTLLGINELRASEPRVEASSELTRLCRNTIPRLIPTHAHYNWCSLTSTPSPSGFWWVLLPLHRSHVLTSISTSCT